MDLQNSSCAGGTFDQIWKTQRSDSPEPSSVSMKSDRSLLSPPEFSKGGEPSSVSMKSDRSLLSPPEFSKGGEPSSVSMKSDRFLLSLPEFIKGGEPSSVSMKSDRSLLSPPEFSKGGEPSSLSMKSDRSLLSPPEFRKGGEPSSVSMKSDRSLLSPPEFSKGGVPSSVSMKSDQSLLSPPEFSKGGEPSSVSMKSDRSLLSPPEFSKGGEPSKVSMKSDWSLLSPPELGRGGEPSSVSVKSDRSWETDPAFSSGADLSDSEQCSTGTVPQIHTLMKGTEESDGKVLHRVFERHKNIMRKRYESLFEGFRTPENKALLNNVYTQLHIIEGESEGVNEEHEVLHMETTHRIHQQDAPIHCSDIFKPLQGTDGGVKAEDLRLRDRKEDQEIRSVLTKGIAGIGKSVSVQKFILDWAEGAANQEVDLMFVLPFRELNLIKDDQYSLHRLLCAFHPELKDLDPEKYDQLRAVFIFDGLDESRVPLDFKQFEKMSDVTMTSSVGALMTNLIRGDLLPSALIWITSRPAAANQIPPQYINRETEIQGFTDPQKEEYFRKRIRNQDQAQKIISHIKTARSLHIMCHIPVFCWISATVLQRIITQCHTEIPKTLTEMYSHFLLTQTTIKNEKYKKKNETDTRKLLVSNRTELLKLAELAFTQLLKGNVMFYEEDLRESSIDVTEASVYSGIFTEIFREECVIHQRKVYCFVHLSFQEFLAAVFVFHCYEDNIMEPLQCFILRYREGSEKVLLDDLLKGAVDKGVACQNGHLDLFLRFLLGLSLESNQRLLQGLLAQIQSRLMKAMTHFKNLFKKHEVSLTQMHSGSEKTTDYIKRLIKGDKNPISTERSINLFLCLSEMNDQSLSREIKEYLHSYKNSVVKLSPGQCSALACMLLTSEEELDELDLGKYNTSVEGYRRLIPAVTVCRKARLALCNLGVKACEALSPALQSVNSSLKELDLSNNDLQDSGLELFSAGLMSSHCQLETLKLARCNLQVKACEILSSVFQLVNSTLKELDLSNNDLHDTGVDLLSAGLRRPLCKLESLRLSGCMITDEGCSSLASALKSNPSHLRELDLSYNHPGELGVKLFSDLLQDPHCALEKLQVEHGGKRMMKPGPRKWSCDLTLDPNTANPHLVLSYGNTNVKWLEKIQPYPDHPERFDQQWQVLSVESLTGRCYWEVEWSGNGAEISVSYRGIRRKGDSVQCLFGFNNVSWSLICSGNRYWVRHNNQKTYIIPDHPSQCNRVGVFLDWGSGALSFYTISPQTHALTHLHTLTSTFTEPLYAGFKLYHHSSVSCVTDSHKISALDK